MWMWYQLLYFLIKIVIDFDTDKLIIFHYPRGTGGKFVINCLGLGDNAVFQDNILAQAQVNNQLNSLTELLVRLDETKKLNYWNDLSLGCVQLFSGEPKVNNTDVILTYPKIETIVNLINNNFYFFLAAHNVSGLNILLKLWPNAVVVSLSDYDIFLSEFERESYKESNNLMLHEYWNNVKGPDWPKLPPNSYQQLLMLPDWVLAELQNDFHGMIDNFYIKDNATNFKEDFTWQTDCIFNEELFLTNVEKLYKKLNITGFNKNNISAYRIAYLDTLHILNRLDK